MPPASTTTHTPLLTQQWARFGRSALQTLNCCSQRTSSCAPRGYCGRRISKGAMAPFGSNTVCSSAGPTERTGHSLDRCVQLARSRRSSRALKVDQAQTVRGT
jgi:hypothetical protein